MEVGTVREAPAGVTGALSPTMLRLASDDRLVALVRGGSTAAFEAAYGRHYHAILSYCRQLLGSADEAEDAVQHTFLAAYRDLITSEKQIYLRAWLFAIARNRCYSMLRLRREIPLAAVEEPITEWLATEVQRRQDVRDLVADLGTLPHDQREALVLSELGALSHRQIASVLEVPRDRVKALVFQARETLVALRTARETDCSQIREQLSTLRGAALRRGNLRRHLRQCAGCREFRRELDSRPRGLVAILPVGPILAFKGGVLAASSQAGDSGVVSTGTAFQGSSEMAKGLIVALLAGVGTAGTIVATGELPSSHAGAHRSPRTAMRQTAPSYAPIGAPTEARRVPVGNATRNDGAEAIKSVAGGLESVKFAAALEPDPGAVRSVDPRPPVSAGSRPVSQPARATAPKGGTTSATNTSGLGPIERLLPTEARSSVGASIELVRARLSATVASDLLRPRAVARTLAR